MCGALSFLPVSPLPQVDYPVINVTASLPGASPETMASSVATPLERSLGSIAGISEMTSSSALKRTTITLEFNLDKDINNAAREVQAAINAAQNLLPSGMPSRPRYYKSNPSDAPIMILTMTSETMGTGEIYDIASTRLAQRIAKFQLVAARSLPYGLNSTQPPYLTKGFPLMPCAQPLVVLTFVNRKAISMMTKTLSSTD